MANYLLVESRDPFEYSDSSYFYQVAQDLAGGVGAALCGLVGHTVILYRPHPETPRIAVPERSSAAPS